MAVMGKWRSWAYIPYMFPWEQVHPVIATKQQVGKSIVILIFYKELAYGCKSKSTFLSAIVNPCRNHLSKYLVKL
jgi:hypothetical protein